MIYLFVSLEELKKVATNKHSFSLHKYWGKDWIIE